MSAYPTIITFDIAGSRRQAVLDQADALGLPVTYHQGGSVFDVEVDSPLTAYKFGLTCGAKGIPHKTVATRKT